MFKTELVEGGPQFWINGGKQSSCILAGIKKRSLRRSMIELDIPHSTIQDFQRTLGHMFPYKIPIVHELQQLVYEKLVSFFNRV